MKLIKKVLALSLAFVLTAASLTACVYDKPEQEEEPKKEDTTGTEQQAAFNYSDGLTAEGKWEGVDALSLVTLPKLEGVEIPADKHTISDNAVQEQVDGILMNLQETKKVTDRAITDKDTVNIDYVGKVDGVEFEGGNTKGSGTSVTIGVTKYIDNFLEQLVGHKPGETFDINVTFPTPYETNPDLAGKPAVFTTTVNYIEEKVTPELTDELVSKNLSSTYGWNTVDEMRTGIRKQLEKSAMLSYIQQYFIDNTEFKGDLPQTIVDVQKKVLVENYKNYAKSNNMDLATMLQYMGFESEDDLVNKSMDNINKSVKLYVTLQAVADQLKLEATDENIKAYFVENTGSEDYSRYVTAYGEPYVKMMVLQTLALNHVRDNAVKL